MITTLAVKASMPFAAAILTDAEARWRGPFAAAYLVALVVIAGCLAGPDAILGYFEGYSALIANDAVSGMI